MNTASLSSPPIDVYKRQIMGTLLLTSFLMVLGNLLSDIIVAAVDPRIKFE